MKKLLIIFLLFLLTLLILAGFYPPNRGPGPLITKTLSEKISQNPNTAVAYLDSQSIPGPFTGGFRLFIHVKYADKEFIQEVAFCESADAGDLGIDELGNPSQESKSGYVLVRCDGKAYSLAFEENTVRVYKGQRGIKEKVVEIPLPKTITSPEYTYTPKPSLSPKPSSNPTSLPTGEKIIKKSGEIENGFLIKKISQDSVEGIENYREDGVVAIPYFPRDRTLHIDDDIGLSCAGISEKLIHIDFSHQTVTFYRVLGQAPSGGCPI